MFGTGARGPARERARRLLRVAVLLHRRRLRRVGPGPRRQPRARTGRAGARGAAGDPARDAAAAERGAAGVRLRGRRPGRLDALCGACASCRAAPRSACAAFGRRKRRSVATAPQISLAVATLLSLLVARRRRGDRRRAATSTTTTSTSGSRPWPASRSAPRPARLVASTTGVRDAQGWMQNDVRVEGRDAAAWGLPARPLMSTRVDEGRWYTEAEVGERRERRRARSDDRQDDGQGGRRRHPRQHRQRAGDACA